MLGKNLKYYRLKNGLSKAKLAEKVGVSPMSITHYESDERKPSMDILKALATALNVKVSDFLANEGEIRSLTYGEFRKGSKLSKNQQEYIYASLEEYMNRFYYAVRILGGKVMPTPPDSHGVQLSSNAEDDAKALRKYLHISEIGPVGNLVEMLENIGILVYFIDIDNDAFSGINGQVNGRPYIAVNGNMSPERIRSTIVHEMAHFIFEWPEDMEDDRIEDRATAISGAFLLPEEDAKRELGLKRRAISNDMQLICKEYGISMFMLAKRAVLCGIVSDNAAKNFYILASQNGWRKSEPVRIPKEEPTLFSQLIFRAVSESEISIQKGAELLKKPYTYVAEQCFATKGEL